MGEREREREKCRQKVLRERMVEIKIVGEEYLHKKERNKQRTLGHERMHNRKQRNVNSVSLIHSIKDMIQTFIICSFIEGLTSDRAKI